MHLERAIELIEQAYTGQVEIRTRLEYSLIEIVRPGRLRRWAEDLVLVFGAPAFLERLARRLLPGKTIRQVTFETIWNAQDEDSLRKLALGWKKVGDLWLEPDTF
jgi:hypothetical protein